MGHSNCPWNEIEIMRYLIGQAILLSLIVVLSYPDALASGSPSPQAYPEIRCSDGSSAQYNANGHALLCPDPPSLKSQGTLPSVSTLQPQAQSVGWAVSPSYESPTRDTSVHILLQNGEQSELYSESNAFLIFESDYVGKYYEPTPEAAKHAETILAPILERDRFRVVVWRNLDSAQMKSVIDNIFSTYGHNETGRLFFYFFGHGDLTNSNDPGRAQGWLIPINIPSKVENEPAFFQLALPMDEVVHRATASRLKHAFLAFEACHGGFAITSLATMGPTDIPNVKGYILAPSTQEMVRQFLTAGSDSQLILADNMFTDVLVGALNDPTVSSNKDNFLTGKMIGMAVKTRLPQYSANLPKFGEWSFPGRPGGDFVFGPAGGFPHEAVSYRYIEGKNASRPKLAPPRPVPTSTSGSDTDAIQIPRTDRAVWDIGTTTCGVPQAMSDRLDSRLAYLGFSTRRAPEFYRKASEANYGLAETSRVFYYDPATEVQAMQLSADLGAYFGVKFASPILGAGSGLDKKRKNETIFIHLIGSQCRE